MIFFIQCIGFYDNGLNVSNTGYFVYYTGIIYREVFDKRMLRKDTIPKVGDRDDWCAYWNSRKEFHK